MSKSSTARGILTGLVATMGMVAGACTPDEPDDGPSEATPEIQVDACVSEGVGECRAGFGTVTAGSEQTFTLNVTNPGEDELTLSAVDLEAGSDPAFSVTRVPNEPIAANGQDTITVTFRPTVAGPLSTRLYIRSDAVNLPTGQDAVVVDFAGTGSEPGAPHLTLTPAECHFGEVATGATTFCEVAVGNTGSADLVVTDFGITPESDPAFEPAGPLAPGAQVPPGSAATLRLQFGPTEARDYAGSVFLETNDATNPTVSVPLTGAGGEFPTAIARILSINGTDVTSPVPLAHPLDDVVLSGADSVAGTSAGSIVAYHWELIDAQGGPGRPAGSTVELTTPDAATTGFQFDSSASLRDGLDLVGTFSACLTVTDDAASESTNLACSTVTTTPADDLHVQLTWAHPTADLDLHLLRGPGPRFTGQDCYYANCKSVNHSVDWGGDAANPYLDVDDIDGFGPEIITISTPASGSYSVGVHWYSGGPQDTQSIEVTAKIFVQGALVGEYTRAMTGCNQWWDVARVVWADAETLEDIDTVTQIANGACF